MLHLLLTPKEAQARRFLHCDVAVFKDKVVAFSAERILMALLPAPFANRESGQRRHETTFSKILHNIYYCRVRQAIWLEIPSGDVSRDAGYLRVPIMKSCEVRQQHRPPRYAQGKTNMDVFS